MTMKHVVLRIVLVSAFLFALMIFMGGVGSPQAHAAGLTTSHVSTQVVPDINRVDCDGREDFVRIYNNTGELCFANAGNMQVFIDQVVLVCSGNNPLFMVTNLGGISLSKWQCRQFGDLTITFLQI